MEASSAPVEKMGVRRVITRAGWCNTQGVLPRMALPVRLFVGGRLGKRQTVVGLDSPG
jgi:NAD dependent epimerase/dehydratase family enzyme